MIHVYGVGSLKFCIIFLRLKTGKRHAIYAGKCNCLHQNSRKLQFCVTRSNKFCTGEGGQGDVAGVEWG